MSKRSWLSHKEERRREGAIRNERWAALSAAQKLAELDRRLGLGIGAKRQRAKLGAKLGGGKS